MRRIKITGNMILTTLFIYIALALRVLADVEITAPASGKTYSAKGGSAEVEISWKDDASDDDSDTSLTKAKTYSILLCTGSSSTVECLSGDGQALVDGRKYSYDGKASYTAKIDADLADDGYYFFQIYIAFNEDASEYSIHYSNRFELKDMTGSTSDLTVKNTYTGDSPAAQTKLDSSSIDSKSFSLAYTKQTGSWKFAPMQLQPGTKVTATSWSRLFPTSDVTYYSTKAKTPNAASTITPGWSYTFKTKVNWAAAAPTPSVRYAPSDRVTAASLLSASKKRRWLD